MPLTQEQLIALREDITITKAEVVYEGLTLAQWWNVGDDGKLAQFYNQPSDPAFVVWRSSVQYAPLMLGQGFDWTRVDNLTVGKARIADFMVAASQQQMQMQGLTFTFANPGVVAGVEQTFSVEAGDQPCRQAIYTSASRVATYGEELYATGAGNPPTHHGVGPGVLVFEGDITATDVGQSRSA